MSDNVPAPPHPDEIRAARTAAGLSRADAAVLIYRSKRGWEKFESGERKMDPVLWESWLLKVSQKVAPN
jgi:DNA-binding transcriptional regulator YiaG